jgi:hypothetical protein
MDNVFFTLRKGVSESISPEDALLNAWIASEKDDGYETKDCFKTCEVCGAND